MDLKKETKEIDGLTLKTQQLPAMRAFTLFARLMKTVGPALGALSKLDPHTQLTDAAGELAAAFAGLDAEEAAKLVPDIFASTNVERDGKYHPLGTTSAIDLTFSGRLMTLFKCVGWVLQVNYRDFFSGSGLAEARLPGHSEG